MTPFEKSLIMTVSNKKNTIHKKGKMIMIRIPDKVTGRPKKRPSLEVLATLYADHTAGEIAEMYGVTESTVRYWLWYYRQEQKAMGE